MGGIVLPEEHKPAVDEGCDWPLAYSPVTFGGMEAEAPGPEVRGEEGGGFANPKEKDVGEEHEAVNGADC